MSAAEIETCQQNGLQISAANASAFITVLVQIQNQPGALGPSLNNDPAALRELQQLLASWGYPVAASGTFDQATSAAVVKFKKDNNITYPYTMADGSAGTNAYVDQVTKAAMMKKLQG